jgi:hypothetical protein
MMVYPAMFYGNGTDERRYRNVENNTILNMTEETVLLSGDSGFNVRIESYSDKVKDEKGLILTNVVQDILGTDDYDEFNKGFSRFEKIKIYPSNETDCVETVVLFNLDIYSFLSDMKNPMTDIDRRIEYNDKAFLSYPLVLQVDLKELKALLTDKLGHPGRGMLYYFEPESPGSDSGKWYSVSHLKELGDIDYSISSDGIATITIYKWPEDDRVHVGA